MKMHTLTAIFAAILLSLGCGKLSAQTNSSTPSETLSAGPQAVTNQVVVNPNVLVLTGRIIDAETGKPVTNAKINFDKFGDELLQASMDDKGNYAIALNKSELGEPIRVIFKVQGYKRYVVKSVDKSINFVDADIFLEPVETAEKSNANIKYQLNDDPFNPLVIKMQ